MASRGPGRSRRATDAELEAANRAHAERNVRTRSGFPERRGIVEKVVRGRKDGLLKAKCLWDDGGVSYAPIAEIDIY